MNTVFLRLPLAFLPVSSDVWCVVSSIRHAACGVVEVFLQYITFVSQVFDRTQ